MILRAMIGPLQESLALNISTTVCRSLIALFSIAHQRSRGNVRVGQNSSSCCKSSCTIGNRVAQEVSAPNRRFLAAPSELG